MNETAIQRAMKMIAKRAAGEMPDQVSTEELPPEEQAAMGQELAQQEAQNPEVPAEAAGGPGPEGPEVAGAAGEPQIVDMLIAAYCSEKVSEYQYEQAINACLGKARNYFLIEATEHRKEEGDHADMLATRIDELGGVIPFTVEEVAAQNPAGSPQEVENNRDTAILTQQIIEAEQKAVELYSLIEEATRDTDPVTNDMIIDILATEQKHVVDMSKILMTIGM